MSDELRKMFEDGDEAEIPEEESPLIVSVVDEEGEEHTFQELDSLELGDEEFVALLPIDDEDVSDEEGELIILRRTYSGDDIYLEPIEDEEQFMRIGMMFEERLSDRFEFDDI